MRWDALLMSIGLACFEISSWQEGSLVSGLMCYICGQSNLREPGECSTQFQYDCNSYARRFPRGTNVLCRTSRHAAPNNTFTMLKECIAESEHVNMFPNGKRIGCDTLFDNTGYEIKYCVCDRSLCNGKPLSEQFLEDTGRRRVVSVGGPQVNEALVPDPVVLPQSPVRVEGEDKADSGARIAVNANVNVNSSGKAIGAPVAERFSTPVAQPSNIDHPHPSSSPPSREETTEHGILSAPQWPRRPGPAVTTTTAPFAGRTSREELLTGWITTPKTTVHFRERPTAIAVRGLVCQVCSEGNLPGPEPECTNQETVDCNIQGSAAIQAYCFTRHATFATGLHSIQKLCVSSEALIAEYGDRVKMDGCSMSEDNTVHYCVCDTPHCNRPSIERQMSRDPPFEYREPGEPVETGLIGPSKCYICGESGMSYPSDCPQQHEYECGLQYAGGTKVMCLTRLVRVADQYNIEKRCISEEEHLRNYPGNTVAGNGCSSAWQGYVEYCVCDGDLCNMQNLTMQQRKVGYSQTRDHVATTQRPAERRTTIVTTSAVPWATTTVPHNRPRFPDSSANRVTTAAPPVPNTGRTAAPVVPNKGRIAVNPAVPSSQSRPSHRGSPDREASMVKRPTTTDAPSRARPMEKFSPVPPQPDRKMPATSAEPKTKQKKPSDGKYFHEMPNKFDKSKQEPSVAAGVHRTNQLTKLVLYGVCVWVMCVSR